MDESEDTATHPTAVALLDYVVGELAPDASDDVRRHVDGCAACRERIVALASAMDELDRLPSVPPPTTGGRARRATRLVPILLLLAAAVGVIGLFEVGGLTPAPTPPTSGRVVLETAAGDPSAVVADLLGGIPHRVTVDRDDPRHLVVLVAPGDAGVAAARIAATRSDDGRTYAVDVAESTALTVP